MVMSPPIVASRSPTKRKLLPFASTTDSTLHRPVWKSTRAIESSPRSPRRPPSRFRGQLRYDLLGPPLPPEPISSTPESPACQPADDTAKPSTADRKSIFSNLEDLRWLEHQWLGRRGKSSNLKATREQLALMRRWFDSLDTDGSGEVGVAELEDPLVSVGLACNRDDVQQLIEDVGPSASGGVTFDSFLNLLYPEKRRRDRRPKLPLPLHMPKHRSPRRPVTSPVVSTRSRAGSRPTKHSMQNSENKNANPVARLFEDLQEGKLGDLAIPFPVLITAYRRRMLLDAHMAEDPTSKRIGSSVLRALEASTQETSTTYDWKRTHFDLQLPSLS